MATTTPDGDQLLAVLERARTVGFLGPGPLRVHRDHSDAFAVQLLKSDRRLLDLGSGGGVPGLPVFHVNQSLEGALLDTSEKRCTFLQWAVAELGMTDRVEVIHGRAEEAAHDSAYRETFDVVTARGFAPPPETTECGTGFLTPGGRLVISEPPELRTWNAGTLSELALRQVEAVPHEAGLIAVFERQPGLDPALPRPWRRQQKRPYLVVEE